MSGPSKKFSWTLRSARLTNPNVGLRDTSTFANVLHETGGMRLAPATINKLERGTLPFSIDHCFAFEKALGLSPGLLVDIYCYTMRMHDMEPRGRLRQVREATA